MTVAPEPLVFDFGSGPVAFRSWDGPGRITFVCVHSLMGSSAEWHPVASALSRLGRVLALDLPGFGSAPLAGRLPTLGSYRREVAEFVSAAADAPVVLIGSSLGGLVAASVAAEHPDLVRALVLGSSYLPPYFAGWRSPAVVASLTTEKAALLASATRGRLLRHGLMSPGPGPLTPPGGWGGGWTRLGSSVWLIAEMIALSVRPGRAEDRYDRIRCPVLVLHGDEDQLVPVEWAYWAGQRHPAWRVETMRSVGHVVKAGAESWWVERVEQWLTGPPDDGLGDQAPT